MSSLTLALISAICIFAGVLVGMILAYRLPNHHLSSESKDAVKVGAGMIATLTALVLGLLISSSKASYDTMNDELVQTSAKIIFLDRLLANYGDKTESARRLLRRTTATSIQLLWPEHAATMAGLSAFEKIDNLEPLQIELSALTPASDMQRQFLLQAMQICYELRQTHWLLVEQAQSVVPMPMLIMLLFWITMLFVSYGLFAPRNATVVVMLVVCSLSVSGAIFMIHELSQPLSGMVKVSSMPMVKAFEVLGGD